MNSLDAAKLVAMIDDLAFEKAMAIRFESLEYQREYAEKRAGEIREQMRALLTTKVKGQDDD